MAYLFHECLKIAKLFQDGFVGNGAYILYVVEGLSFFLARHTPNGLPRINTFKNTESPKVFERNLEHFQTFGSSNKGRFETGVSLFLFLAHARKLALTASI